MKKKSKKDSEKSDAEVIEEIVTCRCTHTLSQHGPEGCAESDCACELERAMLLVGKVQAVDEL